MLDAAIPPRTSTRRNIIDKPRTQSSNRSNPASIGDGVTLMNYSWMRSELFTEISRETLIRPNGL
jgi:hypothetical protein